MIDTSQINYPYLDRPEVISCLFHPRPELPWMHSGPGVQDKIIPVADEVGVGARFHLVDKLAPNILFFHGNGEIVADYDELGPVYHRLGINFFPVDYRGYGRSTGKPTVTAMMRDCHVILNFVHGWLQANGYSSPLIVMGRSLGSASVLELAAHYPTLVNGLIVESGFAWTSPLLKVLGINPQETGFKEEDGLGNLDKIRTIAQPTLIIHGQYDQLIPFANAQALYDACPAPKKTLLKILGADHNDILLQGFSQYMEAIKSLIDNLMVIPRNPI